MTYRELSAFRRRQRRIKRLAIAMPFVVIFVIAYLMIKKPWINNTIEKPQAATPQITKPMLPTPTPYATKKPTATPTPEPTPTEEPEEEFLLDISEEDRILLKRIAFCEMEGESVESKALVMNVILNRVNYKWFPNTIADVIFQNSDGVYQFTPVGNGRWDRCTEWDAGCEEALEMVLHGWDESQGALFFRVITTEPCWHDQSLEKLFDFEHTRYYR